MKPSFEDVSSERRQLMSKIRGTNTSIEVLCRKYLFARGFRYRKNVRSLPGTPDIVLNKYKTAIFVNGCFWHHHEGCKKARIPKTHVDFWQKKIDKNISNDQMHKQQLEFLGWQVITIWECKLTKKLLEQTMEEVIERTICYISRTR